MKTVLKLLQLIQRIYMSDARGMNEVLLPLEYFLSF